MSTREQGGLNIDRIRNTKLTVFSLAWGFRCAASLTSGCPEPVTVCFAHWAPSPFLLLHLHLHPFRFISSICALDLGHPIHGSRSRSRAARLRSPHTAHCTISYQSIASGSRPIYIYMYRLGPAYCDLHNCLEYGYSHYGVDFEILISVTLSELWLRRRAVRRARRTQNASPT